MRCAVAGGDCCGACEFFLAPVGQENGACRRFPPVNRTGNGTEYQPVDAELIACGEFRHWMDQVKPAVVCVRPATLRKVER